MEKRKRKSFFKCLSEISKQSEILLFVGFSVIIAEFIAVICAFLRDYKISKIYAVTVYPEVFSYIMMSLTLLIGGALLIDYVIKSYE